MGARERTVKGWGGCERHGVDKIGCGELRREPHERARRGGGPPEMAEEGLGSEGGGGMADRIGRDEGGGSNDGKMSTEYARTEAIQECGRSGGDVGGVPDEKWIQGEVSDRVKGERVSWQECWWEGILWGEPEGEMSRRQDVRKRAAWESVYWERRDEEAGRWKWSIRGVTAPGGVKCVRTQKGLVQCVRTLTCPSGRIGYAPFTSGRNEPGPMLPAQELTL